MLVSVALATYNGQDFLEAQLESIASQTRKPDEIVICDDCSSDKTLIVAEAFSSMHKDMKWVIIRNEKNQGYIRNFFTAIEHTHGDIIILSDQDDIWDKRKVETFVNWFSTHEDMLSIHTDYSIIDRRERILRKSAVGYKHYIAKYSAKEFCSRLNYSGMSSAFRSSVKRQLLMLNPNNIPTHDWTIHALSIIDNGMYVSSYISTYRRYTGNNVALNIEKERDRFGVNQRVEVIQNYIDYFTLLGDLSDILNDDKIRRYVNRLLDVYDKRITNLTARNVFAWIKDCSKAIRLVPCRAYLCDVLYIIGYY